jgi:hypothetical protein
MSTPLDICSSPKSTKVGLTTNGRAFYSVVRLIHVLILVGIYRFQVPKRQRTELRRDSKTVRVCSENRHLGLFFNRGVDGPRILGDHTKAWLHRDTAQQLMEPCALRLWPNDNLFVLCHHASDSDSHVSLAWFNVDEAHLDKLSSHSTDLNYMENLWAGLKRRVESRRARSIRDSKQICSAKWVNTSQLFCSYFVDINSDQIPSDAPDEGFTTR